MSHIPKFHRLLSGAIFCQLLFTLVAVEQSYAQPVIENAKIVVSKSDSAKFIALFKIINAGEADALIGVSSKDAGKSVIYSPDTNVSLPIPAGNSPALSLDGAYIVMEDIKGEMTDGRQIPLLLKFEKAGELLANAVYKAPKKAMDHATMDHSTMDHAKMDHAAKDDSGADQAQISPSLSIKVTKVSGTNAWKVDCDISEFEFSKAHVDGPHIPGIGHGHLYVDGIKIKRIYKPTADFGALLPGKHTVRITLNTNDHHAYSNNGKKVTATAQIEVY